MLPPRGSRSRLSMALDPPRRGQASADPGEGDAVDQVLVVLGSRLFANDRHESLFRQRLQFAGCTVVDVGVLEARACRLELGQFAGLGIEIDRVDKTAHAALLFVLD